MLSKTGQLSIAQGAEGLEPVAAGVGKVEGLPTKTSVLLNEIEGQTGKVSTVEGQLGKVVEQEAKQLDSQIKSARQTAEVATEWCKTIKINGRGMLLKNLMHKR